jgi:uncharacterized paraquat-inducible protein A
MALVHCRECGTLNSDQAEICLSCEYPIKGRARTNWLKWMAILLAIVIGLPVGLVAVEIFRQTQPSPPPPVPTKQQPG